MVSHSTVTYRKALQSNGNTKQVEETTAAAAGGDVALQGNGVDGDGTDRLAQGENAVQSDLDPQANVENIMDPSERPGGGLDLTSMSANLHTYFVFTLIPTRLFKYYHIPKTPLAWKKLQKKKKEAILLI